ncbi:MAG: formylglycine-generating enzyme family protein [Betaproteobacteria bacterium]|nr:formylglycine-generating enzyme family protein [Betaproteobacteria bacterium]
MTASFACLAASTLFVACASIGPETTEQVVAPASESVVWQETETVATGAYKAYLEAYPKGSHAAIAQNKLNALQSGGVPAAVPAVPAGVPAVPATDARQPGKTFRDCDDCPEMVVIPAGSFQMGSSNSEAGRYPSEDPIHKVTLARDFALGKTHITRGQFSRFVRATGHDAGGKCYTFENGNYMERSERSWRDPGFEQKDDHPAVCVNWSDAKAYVEWLSRKTGKNYRLPSEAEWEYAARAGTATARYWGDNPDQACSYANVMDSAGKEKVPGVNWESHNCSDGYAYTSPAASFKPNAFGLYDMIGNAWEWTEDCWNENYTGAPTDGSAWKHGECLKRVLRGGSWYYTPRYARSATRYRFLATFRNYIYGFRIASSLP